MKSNNKYGLVSYLINDDLSMVPGSEVFYRIKITRSDGSIRYSSILKLNRTLENSNSFLITPNPVTSNMQVKISSEKNQLAVVKIFNALGSLMVLRQVSLIPGNNIIDFEGFEKWGSGIYPVQVQMGGKMISQKMILTRKK